jgi:hypothetical protein
MLSKILCTAAALFLVTGLSFAADKPVKGKVKSYDAEKKVLVLTTGKKGETVDKEYKVADDLKLTLVEGDDKKELAGKDALGCPQIKAGANVEVTADGDKITAISITMKKKK